MSSFHNKTKVTSQHFTSQHNMLSWENYSEVHCARCRQSTHSSLQEMWYCSHCAQQSHGGNYTNVQHASSYDVDSGSDLFFSRPFRPVLVLFDPAIPIKGFEERLRSLQSLSCSDQCMSLYYWLHINTHRSWLYGHNSVRQHLLELFNIHWILRGMHGQRHIISIGSDIGFRIRAELVQKWMTMHCIVFAMSCGLFCERHRLLSCRVWVSVNGVDCVLSHHVEFVCMFYLDALSDILCMTFSIFLVLFCLSVVMVVLSTRSTSHCVWWFLGSLGSSVLIYGLLCSIESAFQFN